MHPRSLTESIKKNEVFAKVELFNVYTDELSKHLNGCNTGCLVGNSVINHLMYADDLVIFSPYNAGLQQLMKVCSQYGKDDIKYE